MEGVNYSMSSDYPLGQIVSDFAWAFKRVDDERPQPKPQYRPGIGPLGEDEALRRALDKLRKRKPELYANSGPKQYPGTRRRCDLVIPNRWAIEFKLVRPFRDNGQEAEEWITDLLYPYPAIYISSGSAISDSIKLAMSGFLESKAIIVFGYEHEKAKIRMASLIEFFEFIAEKSGVILGSCAEGEFLDLVHPVHKNGRVYGWEVREWIPRLVGLLFPTR
ncbi:MAG: hypothetical protein QXT68_01285 [Halobacteria archaeon]